MSSFPKNLKKLLQSKGLSASACARLCGLGERRFAFYVQGTREPNLDTLTRIARVLECTTDELLGNTQAKSTLKASWETRTLQKMKNFDAREKQLANSFIEQILRSRRPEKIYRKKPKSGRS
ncbi:MAG: helix-turn-helix domain-containing protein [Alphaproteobacteria bacterium]|nr:helix-turn-helix domain-containing protein [Alphaproteobacteria bacterium]